MSQRENDQAESVSSQERRQIEETEQRATWRRPKLQRLRLSLDTAADIGSNTDGFDGSLN